MTGTKPQLITFAISHYCEKARWALDWLGVDYRETVCPPGWNVVLAKALGARESKVPFLVDGKRVIEGSGAIVDWADERAADPSRRLTSPEALEIEARADESVGVNARRLFYAEAIPRTRPAIKQAFSAGYTPMHRFIGHMTWPFTILAIKIKYDVWPGAAEEARARLEAELDWLDGLLADGRQYLAGGRFSRADITVASLLGPLSPPERVKTYHGMALPEALIKDYERWKDRPVMRWLAERYQNERVAGSPPRAPVCSPEGLPA
jgi:glutathione S-transferase